jgi:hypothetical protein
LTDEQIKEHSQDHPVLKRDVAKDIFDTFDRDLFIDAVVVAVLGERYRWPTYGDSDEYKARFYPQFYRKAIKKGIKVTAAAGRIACTTN